MIVKRIEMEKRVGRKVNLFKSQKYFRACRRNECRCASTA